MPSSKPLRNGAPQISISSWIMGGPIVTKPQRPRVKPVLVTTEPAKLPKPAEDPKPNGKMTENGKKAEEAKSDAASKGSETEKSDDDWTWTAEQDALILKLKGENTSWKGIASRMSLAKSDIQVRFKELQKEAAKILAANTEQNSKSKDGEEGNQIEAKKDEKKSGERKKADGNGDGSVNGGRLKPDDSWSREDCEILEMLEARYREQKWLSMQASFYNMTGRMIRADIIERKLSEARS